MSFLAQIKQWESRRFRAIAAFCSSTAATGTHVVGRFLAALKTSMSIVIVTETSSAPRGYRLRLATVMLLLASPIALAFGSAVLLARSRVDRDLLQTAAAGSMKARTDLDEIRDAANDLQKTIPTLEAALNSLSDTLGRNGQAKISASLSLGLGRRKTDPGTKSTIPELEAISRTRRTLEEASRLLEEGGARIVTRQKILQELPSLWPVEGNLGYITTYFGASTNPFTGMPYFHKGLDIANARQGDPVVATADGKVVTAGYDPSYGNMVILQHPNGYYTRYGHMQSLSVRKGQVVKKGARIGKIGNTGLSTGAHVHYEVLIGGQLFDPLEYIDLPRGRMEAPGTGFLRGRS